MDKPTKAVRREPIDGPEPQWVHDLPVDNLLGGMTALLAEVCILTDRVAALEKVLEKQGIIEEQAVEGLPRDHTISEKKIRGIVARFWGEVGRGPEPWSSVPSHSDAPSDERD